MPAPQRLACSVERIVRHGGRVYTVVLRPERPAPAFKAGQFLHLALDPYDPTGFWPESRVFSIASPPSRRDRLSITYSVAGRFTTRMENELGEGVGVWVKLPYGTFIVKRTTDVVLFAGGTGITAFTAFLDELPPPASQAITLAYGARTRDLLIYRDLVERCLRNSPEFNVSYFLEEAGGEGERIREDPRKREQSGRVSVDAMWPLIGRPMDAEYYISGPPAMLRGIGQQLRDRGISSEKIHIDAWE